MKAGNKLKIFKRTRIGYLKRLYNKSINYLLENESWKSFTDFTGDSSETSEILQKTRDSLLKWGSELSIFKAPAIVGIKIIYYKSMAFLFDHYPRPVTATLSEDNYLYRDLSGSESPNEKTDKELKIFNYPTIESLKTLYYKSIGKL